jgi:hypothetical protein
MGFLKFGIGLGQRRSGFAQPKAELTEDTLAGVPPP